MCKNRCILSTYRLNSYHPYGVITTSLSSVKTCLRLLFFGLTSRAGPNLRIAGIPLLAAFCANILAPSKHSVVGVDVTACSTGGIVKRVADFGR